MVIIYFMFLFMFCIMLSVGIFSFSCLNRFLAFHISFNMDVFIVIISFLVLCLVFIAFNPKMFVMGLLSQFLLSVFIMGSKVFHIFFLISAVIERIIVSFCLLHLSHIGDMLFLRLALSYVFGQHIMFCVVIYNIGYFHTAYYMLENYFAKSISSLMSYCC